MEHTMGTRSRKSKDTNNAKRPRSAPPPGTGVTYRKAIVTFIDILGFREIVISDGAEGVLKKLKALARHGITTLTKEEKTSIGLADFLFSDHVVRIRYIDDTPNDDSVRNILTDEINSLLLAQGELINEGVIIRGGVSVGDVSDFDGHVFGPALVAAYETESKTAIFPRIVLDPNILPFARSHPQLKDEDPDENGEAGYLKALLAQGDDGCWFIDYLAKFPGQVDEHVEPDDFFRSHKKLIVDGCISHSDARRHAEG